ncbi:CorA family divalent cation transporter [Saccharospirillum salsuginis]|uniref:Zinc transporter ZntB n=1 Tax=Saccharospirillum salsuginis TaxID=418750 RepID=A0A918KHL3_9GAMM|nr:CorA family divalent cation transporter [Saccharospirillum salsuginis]GGX64194.1 zinc transporter ZntB [Saccharospirillum salsuginis]
MTTTDPAMTGQPSFIIDQWDFTATPAQRQDGLIDSLAGRWIHCQRDQAGLDEWLDRLGIHSGLRQAVLAEDTRPRFEEVPGGFLLILRGVNLTPGAEPDDMLSLRLLWYKDGLISLRKWPFKAISSVRETLEQGKGPTTLDALLVTILEAINLRIDELLEAQELELEELEAIDHITNPQQHLTRLTQLHRRLLRLDRFIRPQVGALERMAIDAHAWLGHRELQLLSNQRDTTMRILETIEMLLQQIQLVRDELQQDLAERMNRNTYWLSVIAGIFLPLGFLTGLLGINVGGMPGVEDPRAFWLTCSALAVVAVVEFLLLRRLRFFGK